MDDVLGVKEFETSQYLATPSLNSIPSDHRILSKVAIEVQGKKKNVVSDFRGYIKEKFGHKRRGNRDGCGERGEVEKQKMV